MRNLTVHPRKALFQRSARRACVNEAGDAAHDFDSTSPEARMGTSSLKINRRFIEVGPVLATREAAPVATMANFCYLLPVSGRTGDPLASLNF